MSSGPFPQQHDGGGGNFRAALHGREEGQRRTFPCLWLHQGDWLLWWVTRKRDVSSCNLTNTMRGGQTETWQMSDSIFTILIFSNPTWLFLMKAFLNPGEHGPQNVNCFFSFEKRVEPDSSRQGQAQEFGICTLVYGLWTFSMEWGWLRVTSWTTHYQKDLIMFSLKMLDSPVFSLLLPISFFVLSR